MDTEEKWTFDANSQICVREGGENMPRKLQSESIDKADCRDLNCFECGIMAATGRCKHDGPSKCIRNNVDTL
jgi:hypothetical protein